MHKFHYKLTITNFLTCKFTHIEKLIIQLGYAIYVRYENISSKKKNQIFHRCNFEFFIF